MVGRRRLARSVSRHCQNRRTAPFAIAAGPVSLSEEFQVEPIINSSPWNAYGRAGSAATILLCLGSRSGVR